MFSIGTKVRAAPDASRYSITTGPEFLGVVVDHDGLDVAGLQSGSDDTCVQALECSEARSDCIGDHFWVSSEYFVLANGVNDDGEEQTLEELVEENESLGDQIRALTVRLEKKKAFFANNRELILEMVSEAV